MAAINKLPKLLKLRKLMPGGSFSWIFFSQNRHPVNHKNPLNPGSKKKGDDHSSPFQYVL
jgi:hypothetical protein